MSDVWYHINDVDQMDSPALVIYLDRVKKNIETVISLAGDVNRLRPHAKTHKSTELTSLLLNAGINKFKCATIAEAEMLARAGAVDVLLAYQPVGPKVDRFIHLIKQFPATLFSCLVDNYDSATNISSQAINHQVKINVFIDLNVGMNRTGIEPKDALELFMACKKLKAIHLIGLHVYDGHITDINIKDRTKSCNDAYQPVENLLKQISKAGFPDPVVVVGGSPTFPIHINRENVECSPGTFIFWDAGYEKGLPEQPFLPAALIVSRVISIPSKNVYCSDLGYKSISSEKELNNRVVVLNIPIQKFIGHSEEHLTFSSESSLTTGTVLYNLPVHICPTCALYENAYIIQKGNIIGQWEIIARNKSIGI